METIAICITTHNRSEVLKRSLESWLKFLPDNSETFIIDDASEVPNGWADFRFETQQGIAKAKNKCIELAKDFDHIFLVDDDVMPRELGWEKPYIESGINHLCLTFERNQKGFYPSPSVRKIKDVGDISYYTAPNGCMLYLRKKCVEIAGGMRPEFGLWGFEHVEYSSRIHAFGLIEHPFMDIKDSLKYFEVLDWSNSVQSSLSVTDRRTSGKINLALYEKFGIKSEFVEYK